MGNKKTLRDHASDLADTLAPHVETARDKAAPVLADARDRAVPLILDARDKAAPLILDARDKAAPYVAEARDRIAAEVMPVVGSALASLDEATEDARNETLRRGKAVTAALKGEISAPEPKRRRRGPLLLMLLGLAGIGYAVASRYSGGKKSSATWQTAYPQTTTSSPAASSGLDARDTAASDPAEAAADATETPHASTTPENPATEVDIDKPSS
jgi:vacuolar-type H+-ATPase subunit H